MGRQAMRYTRLAKGPNFIIYKVTYNEGTMEVRMDLKARQFEVTRVIGERPGLRRDELRILDPFQKSLDRNIELPEEFIRN